MSMVVIALVLPPSKSLSGGDIAAIYKCMIEFKLQGLVEVTCHRRLDYIVQANSTIRKGGICEHLRSRSVVRRDPHTGGPAPRSPAQCPPSRRSPLEQAQTKGNRCYPKQCLCLGAHWWLPSLGTLQDRHFLSPWLSVE
ncbi:uncharacterized protein B0H18DRAFT_1008560 [Fomitopsis serialis]|uniref:uncharacterized protein n=1 Tax=Fomitopsis serialis TaxID=139415 RepID=UPI002007C6D7|nr:uncharacterized protein B0H18DRAFT_1008560 [Neoantrodia serialis]KAH9925824.1 hypothetical protein B0H18DRAFT_1008560 [Neoantrodia serialis]